MIAQCFILYMKRISIKRFLVLNNFYARIGKNAIARHNNCKNSICTALSFYIMYIDICICYISFNSFFPLILFLLNKHFTSKYVPIIYLTMSHYVLNKCVQRETKCITHVEHFLSILLIQTLVSVDALDSA